MRGASGDGQSEWYYLFSPVCQKGGPLTSSPQPSYDPSISVCLDIWQQEEWEEVRVRTPSWGAYLRTLKRDLMEII
jgi:hypothetical protein